jgi:uncharacterized protein YqjF (DUF2071 family)
MEKSLDARERMRGNGPIFMCDWSNTLFIHLSVDPQALQPFIPYPLDLWEGRAYVSIVAFDQRNFRTPLLGGIPSPVLRPLGSALFCNLRTYVRCGQEAGVVFMREWLPNPVSPLLVPLVYGLPQRLATVHYDVGGGMYTGHVTSENLPLTFSAHLEPGRALTIPEPGTLDDFLLERYTGFSVALGRRLRFHIWHVPWPQYPVQAEIQADSLIRSMGTWWETARPAGGNFSPGVEGVWLGRPMAPGC